jgi:hypothetical protein
MSFELQLRLSHLPRDACERICLSDALPEEQRLQIFSYDCFNEADDCSRTVLVRIVVCRDSVRESASLSRVRELADKAEAGGGEFYVARSRCLAGWTRIADYLHSGDWHPTPSLYLIMPEEEAEDLHERFPCSDADKLGGFPAWYQSNPEWVTCPQCAQRMQFVYQLNDSTGCGQVMQCATHREMFKFVHQPD